MNEPTTKGLEARCGSLLSQTAAIGDFRPGELRYYFPKRGNANAGAQVA